MAKVIKKKKKLKLVPVFLFLLIIGIIGYGSYLLLDMPIRNIVIKGTEILKDQEVIEQAGLENYPSFLQTTSHKIKKRLSTNPYVENVKVKKQLFNKIVIEIKENRILYIDSLNNKMVLSNEKRIEIDDNSLGHAVLINEIDKNYQKEFICKFAAVDQKIISKISEIKYEPTNLDKGRFLFSMTDGNYVYITLTKMKNLNYYEEVLPQLEGKKGILYLDSGNHFEIME